jgi:hypothetical protein
MRLKGYIRDYNPQSRITDHGSFITFHESPISSNLYSLFFRKAAFTRSQYDCTVRARSGVMSWQL